MSHPDTEQTYQALRRAILRAQEAGVRIICEEFTVTRPPNDTLVGCCAVEALERWAPPDFEGLDFPELSGIQSGFDGLKPEQGRQPSPWHEVGLRLRDEFRPITATELERELGATS